ncbi:TRAP transporter substrate-binding protein DctP [Amphritea sp. 1_MG-2023]|uniref:TRAP transporter substrate-binding protein DctP n=1 Tax=Amphritea sp. 1_MG-2023 TaxID=3062670 RepID=UPI0026E147A8|nr:TRAP transporter substrate-binding protein DctP [Amphritea sp. 1_MG-2023]MDO6563351.1 TRAP transporter substrate-binding protein DctP [Amphritea sp. 1_MG-2023]
MKRRDLLKAAATGIAAAPLALSSTSAHAGDNVRLRMQTLYGTETDDLYKAFTNDVKAVSNKSVRIQRFRGSELVPNDQMLDAVSKGTLDMCQGYAGYWAGQLDIGKIESGIPGAWASYDEAIYLHQAKGLTALLEEAYADKGVKYLGPVFGGPYDLLTTKPVNSLEDLKKLKIRATATVAGILEKFDIPTVYLPSQELYVALSTGAIDGVIYGGSLEYKALKLHESAKYYTYLNMINPGYADGMLINLKKWESLSADQQKAIELATAKHAVNMHAWNVNGCLDVNAEGIFEFSSLPEADSKALTTAAMDVWKEEATKSPRNAKAIDAITATAKATGRI